MRNELQRHKTSDKIKWAITGVCFVLVFAFIAGICMQLFADDKYKPSEWFTPVEQAQPDTDCEAASIHTHALSVSLEEDDFNAGIELYAAMNKCFSCGASGFRGLSSSTLLAATCTEVGKELSTCNSCGSSFEGTIPALGHSCTWQVTTAPVVDEVGVESYVCTRCSEVTETRAVYALPDDPVKEGYHFIGWYTDEEFTTPYNLDHIYADTNLYAKFEINTYSVIFDSNGGSEIESITVDWNTVLTPTIPEKKGHTFLGWYLSDGEKYENQAITQNTVLTAHWEILTFTVAFDSNGGNEIESIIVDWNTVLTPTIPEKEGYAFLGWYLSDGEKYENQAITQDTVLTAHWEILTFTVAFDSNGGSEIESIIVDWNTALTPAIPEKTGYNFVGWYLSDGSAYDGQTIKDDTVLTAHWKIIMFKVTFYVDGEVYGTKEVAYGCALSGVVSKANELNLNVIAMSLENGEPLTEAVTGNVSVTAAEMSVEEKIKNNKWKIIGGAAGCVVIVVGIAAICSCFGRKKKHS